MAYRVFSQVVTCQSVKYSGHTYTLSRVRGRKDLHHNFFVGITNVFLQRCSMGAVLLVGLGCEFVVERARYFVEEAHIKVTVMLYPLCIVFLLP